MDIDDEIPGGIEKAEPLKHVGFKSQRVLSAQSRMEILEQILAFRWMEENEQEWCTLDRLVANRETEQGATQRDAKVAATVIQWLGTAAGYTFLKRCFEEAGFKIEPQR